MKARGEGGGASQAGSAWRGPLHLRRSARTGRALLRHRLQVLQVPLRLLLQIGALRLLPQGVLLHAADHDVPRRGPGIHLVAGLQTDLSKYPSPGEGPQIPTGQPRKGAPDNARQVSG